MNAGALDQRVTLRRPVRTSDGAGGVTEAWADLAVNPVVWAAVKAKGGREALVEGRTAASFVVVFTIYYRADIDPTCQIVWQGVAYNIRGILDEGGRKLRLVIEAERGVTQ